jgi:hypothetical protein
MEKINKKLFYIEKTLDKMKKDISTIKTITYNTKDINSCNNSINFSKNLLQVNSNNIKNKTKAHLTKNYFQLSDKEKKFYENKNKKRLQNHLSFTLKYKRPDIYNHVINNSTESNYIINNNNENDNKTNLEKEKPKKTMEKKNKTIFNNHGWNKCKKFNRILMLNEEVNENKKKNDSSFENNYEFESHNIFFDYNANGTNKNCRNRVFSNIMKKNKSENQKNSFNNFIFDQQNKSTKSLSRKLNSRIYNLKYDSIKKARKKIDYDFNDLINNNNKANSNKNIYNSLINRNIGDKYFIMNENSKNNYSINDSCNNLNYKYKELIYGENNESNIDSNSNYYYEKNNNNKNEERHILEEQYIDILNILEGKSINEIKNKALLFDTYGYNAFKDYLVSQKMVYDTKYNLLSYKKYINSFKSGLDNKNLYMKQINSYKYICNKLINMTNAPNLQKIAENINYKLKKNYHNKKVLEKIKNILLQLNINKH